MPVIAWCKQQTASQPAGRKKQITQAAGRGASPLPTLPLPPMACLAGVSGAGRSAKQNLIYSEASCFSSVLRARPVAIRWP